MVFSNILFTDAKSQEDLFDRVGHHLKEVGYVTDGYCDALKEREKHFPTGLKIDLKDGSDFRYAAIPHTETNYCLKTDVVYVRNSRRLIFKHMVNPEEDCFVSDFFFIINDQNQGQTDLLSHVISFFITKGKLEHLSSLGNDKNAISHYLKQEGVLQDD
ncbi:PTS galactose transporter subunit IIA [Streptococcus iniae IUSA1]|nr:PTS galactose transporter subunit IIA [Streptococcus iniae IUSA1]